MVGEEGFDRTGAPDHDPSRCPAKRKYQKRKSPSIAAEALNMVGEEGFEPPTLWSQTRCATKLRYSPRTLGILRILFRDASPFHEIFSKHCSFA